RSRKIVARLFFAALAKKRQGRVRATRLPISSFSKLNCAPAQSLADPLASPQVRLECYPCSSLPLELFVMTPPENPPRLEIVNRDGSPIAPVESLSGHSAIATIAGQ